MIKLLLVDDEDSTREGLFEFIPWCEIGIGKVEIAINGKEALALALDLSPDILLTDIRMPNMDGIELASKIKELLPECKIIFISGFADKEYLKSAIRLNAVGYIEKPLNVVEVTDLLSKAVRLCMIDKENISKEINYNKRISDGVPLLKQKVGAELTMEETNEQNLVKELEMIGFDIASNYKYSTFVIKFKSKDSSDFSRMNIIPERILTDLLLSENFESIFSGFNNGGMLIIHLAFKSYSNSIIQNFAEKLKEHLTVISGEQVLISIGIGKTVQALKELHISYKTAMDTINKIFFYGHGTIIKYDEIVKTSFEADLILSDEYSVGLTENNRSKAVGAIKKITFSVDSNRKIDQVKAYFLKLFIILETEAEKRGLGTTLFIEQGNDEEFLMKMETIFDMSDFIVKRIEMLFDLVENKNQMGGSLYHVKRYIDENYGDCSLSIKSIAEYANYSHYYLCNVFKKNFGLTINEYITRIRIDKAKELLKDKKIKSYEISKKVGYSNANYFIKIFKKYEDCTPAEFKEKYYL